MILDAVLPSGYMMQGALLGITTILLILKFRDGKQYRGR